LSQPVNPRKSARGPASVPRPPGVDVARLADWPAGENIDWITPLAEPYLRGYTPSLERTASLAGYRFFAPGSGALTMGRRSAPQTRRATSAGFFVGYLVGAHGLAFLRPQPPECLVFCFIEPVGGALHRRLVGKPASLVRRTAEYIGWLTHRPPRFEFFAEESVVLARRISMGDWPRGKVQHLSRNFFIETLAWLVRSALVRRLPVELQARIAPATSSARAPRPRAGKQSHGLAIS
jgi:hypothetical protein